MVTGFEEPVFGGLGGFGGGKKEGGGLAEGIGLGEVGGDFEVFVVFQEALKEEAFDLGCGGVCGLDGVEERGFADGADGELVFLIGGEGEGVEKGCCDEE